ncbi:MAG TPA: hypothetical protein VL202_01275 [Pararhizobium sp.]|uniref:helix-turn-helix transcriptional regulator n=1 Tax=Pararhizobium sp. TaxID=1977563 RepID=UPI002BF9A0BE|nr:hypothetical protein [Pararhizobium sp.]HTO29801.1 hypothetical protein [Pararhizobium sp.]
MGKTAITTDTALRLARFFNTTPELWMNLQVGYDLTIEAERNRAEIERIPSATLHETPTFHH